MTTKAFCFIMMTVILSSCEFKCSVGNSGTGITTKTAPTQEREGLTGAIVKNDIDLEATGIKEAKAYLMDEQRQYMEKNEVKPGDKVICTVELDTGWTKI